MKRILVNIIKQSHLHYTTRMEAFLQRQQQTEQTIQLLKNELNKLAQIAEHKQRTKEKKEIDELKADNKLLQKSIESLKSQLQYYETQNGVKQIVIPKRKEQLTVSNAQTKEQKPANQELEQPAKQKKLMEPRNKGKSAPSADAAAKPADISRLCLKAGKIIDAKKHPDADTLLVETVEFGEDKPRTICSGIARFVTPEQMMNKMAIFACNLKPVKIRGISSEGMIMCASTPDQVEMLQVPSGTQIGDRVVCVDFSGEADAILNPKKKIWEKVQPDMTVNSNGVATYKGCPLSVEGKGNCTAPSMKDCPIK